MKTKKNDNYDTIDVVCRHCKKEMTLSIDDVEHFIDNTLYWVECPHCGRVSEIGKEMKSSQEGRRFLKSVHESHHVYG